MSEQPRWRKPSRSNGSNSNCVEVADNLPGRVLVRDSKDQAGPALTFAPEAWSTFVATAATGHPVRSSSLSHSG